MAEELCWYPVSTDRTESGALVSLAGFPSGHLLVPIPLPSGRQHFNRFQDESDNTSIQVASTLGVASLQGVKTNVELTQFSFNYLWYEEVSLVGSEQGPVGGVLWGTKWGAGLRVTVRILSSKSQVNLTLEEIATCIELGTMTASFEAETFGIPASGLIAKLPRPGRLDIASVKLLLQAADDIKNASTDQKAGWTPLPFRVLLPRRLFADQVYDALSTAFAARQIKAGVGYAQAVAKAQAHHDASFLAVRRLYESLALPLDDKPIPEAKRSLADPYL